MLQYGWYVDNSKDFSGMTIWKMSIYVHWCCNMGDILIIQTKIRGVKNWKMSIYVHLCCSMGDMLIIQMGRKHMSTKWGHILSRVAFEFNCIIGKTHTLCERSGLYIYILYYIILYNHPMVVIHHFCPNSWLQSFLVFNQVLNPIPQSDQRPSADPTLNLGFLDYWNLKKSHYIWLVVFRHPSEKWWSESQLGWWHSIPNCFWKFIIH